MSETVTDLLMADPGEFGGVHCETSAVRKALLADGIDISEELLFGLGGGIGFWYQPSGPAGRFRSMTSTRNGPFPVFLERMCAALGLAVTIHRTSDPEHALRELRRGLARGRPAVLYADMYHLPYFQASRHFGGHAVLVYGLDTRAGLAWISDRCPGPMVISAEQLAIARSSPAQPFPPQHAWVEAEWKRARLPGAEGFRAAIRACCASMTQAQAPNEGLAGLASFAAELAADVRGAPADQVIDRLVAAYIDFEYAGTGGSGFRNLYRGFLVQAGQWLPGAALAGAIEAADTARARWRDLTALLIPGWGPASRALLAAYHSRQAALIKGTEDSLRQAAEQTAALPGLLAAAAAELPDYREQLSEQIAAALRALRAAEGELSRALAQI